MSLVTKVNEIDSLLITSDWHWQLTGPFSKPKGNGLTTRIDILVTFFKWLYKLAEDEAVKNILMLGDCFTPKNNISVPLYNLVLDTLARTPKQILAILGNHDRYLNAEDVHSLYAITRALSNYTLLMPWMINDIKPMAPQVELIGVHSGWDQAAHDFPPKRKNVRRVLLLHELVFDTKLPAGEIRGSALQMDKLKVLLKQMEVDVCFMGDNHRPQIAGMKDGVWTDGKYVQLKPQSIVVCGAPYQMSFEDADQPRGVWKYHPAVNAVEFIEYPEGQQFSVVQDDEFGEFVEAFEVTPHELLNMCNWKLRLEDPAHIEKAMSMKLNRTPGVILDPVRTKTTTSQESTGRGLSFNSWDYPAMMKTWLKRQMSEEALVNDAALDIVVKDGMRYIEQAQEEIKVGA